MGKATYGSIGRVSTFILILICLTGLYTAVPQTSNGADDARQLELEKQRTDAQIKDLQKKINSIKQEKNGVEKAIRELDKQESRADNEMYTVQKALSQKRAESSYLEKQYKIADRKFEEYRQKHQDRLVAYYKNGRAGYMEVLFNSTSFSDFISRVYYLQLLTKHDLEIMNRMRDLKSEVTDKRQQVEVNLVQISEQKNMLTQKIRKLDSIQAEKKKTLDGFEQQEKTLAQKLRLLEQQNQEIENMLRNAQGSSSMRQAFSGKFATPLCGRQMYVTSPYGTRKSPKRGASYNHKGLDLRAEYNSDICAAADGEVLEAGYGSGYGNYIIVMHGSGFATVYGHGKKNLVRKGDKVRRGQVIMKANSTGVSTGNHLHFEVRKDSKTVDPSDYVCRKKVSRGVCD